MKEKTLKFFKTAKSLLLIILGNVGMACSVEFFVVPNNLVTGGVAGIGIFLQHFFPSLSLSLFTLIFNIAMLVLGFFFLGRKFFFTTLLSSLVYPAAMAVFELFYTGGALTSDPLLSALVSGALFGLSLGIVFREGASTGGLDIPELIINKYTSFPLSALVYLFDFVIIFLQLVSNTMEMVLYGVVLTFVCSVVIDQINAIGNRKMQFKIVSEKSEEIREAILEQLNRGVTVFYGETGYFGKPARVLMTVMDRREAPHMRSLLEKIDPYAFITVEVVGEVRGRGFTLDKKKLEKTAEKS